MKKDSKEWFIDAPWGKVALISWGDPSGQNVLLVHGRQDSAATFIPLLEYLPDNYYYVAIDLPGHGKSDPLPIGVMITRFHFLASVDYTIKHLGWSQFIFCGHSMGCEQGLFYNVTYPRKVTKFIFFDPIPSLQRLQITDNVAYYKSFYEEYYNNYKKYSEDGRAYSYGSAREAVMKARGLNEDQADIVLSRNLKQIGTDKYRLSWDRRLKYPAPQNYPVDYYHQLFSANAPPTLVVSATTSSGYHQGREAAEKLVGEMKRSTRHFFVETVEGGHDVHLTRPGEVAGRVFGFLEPGFGVSKL